MLTFDVLPKTSRTSACNGQIVAISHTPKGIELTWLNPRKHVTLTKGMAKVFARSLLKS
jgi:hypothetical protein